MTQNNLKYYIINSIRLILSIIGVIFISVESTSDGSIYTFINVSLSAIPILGVLTIILITATYLSLILTVITMFIKKVAIYKLSSFTLLLSYIGLSILYMISGANVYRVILSIFYISSFIIEIIFLRLNLMDKSNIKEIKVA